MIHVFLCVFGEKWFSLHLEAAYLLLQAMPAAMDPDAFAIPPPLSWEVAEAKAKKAKAPEAELGRPERRRAERAEGGHGVPLRLVARHPDVAWEVEGQLQLLIGAAKRTGDPRDVW